MAMASSPTTAEFHSAAGGFGGVCTFAQNINIAVMLTKFFLNEKAILGVILLNAAVIFAQGFNPERPLFEWLEFFDNLFTLLFMIEAIVKIRVWGRATYFGSSWNIFDFVLVLFAMPSFVAWAFNLNMASLEFLLVFRIMRVFKFFRFIRFIPNIDHIVSGLGRAARASVLIIVAFFVFNFTISLISCFLFRDSAPEYFRDPLLSFYSIFKVFTIEGWYEIPDSITEESSPVATFFTRLYFIVVLFFGGIFGLSLVNSIFVDTMVSDNNDALEEKIMELQRKIDALLERER